jgi:hypothetical protein
MAALTAVTPSHDGTVVAGAAVAASDTIARAVMGSLGCFLEIINGNAGADAITISDSGATPGGTSPGTYAASVAAGANKIFFISTKQVNPTTGVVTVTHGTTASVTYKLYPVD